jgi:bifunctional enzyme CysN/CysC
VNAATGSFILIDPGTNTTVAAGTIRGELAQEEVRVPEKSPDVVWEPWNVPREERAARNGHEPIVVWFTGLSGSGKSTIARAVERRLFESGRATMLLDGDQLRHGVSRDLGFALGDRTENVRRAGEIARLFYEHGEIVLCTFVSPLQADRARVRELIPPGGFIEVFVRCPLEECRRRDPKKLYERADSGGIANFTGIASPYEEPAAPDLILDTGVMDVEESVTRVLAALEARGTFKNAPGA